MNTDIYEKVTAKIVADLERGNLTWVQPWHADHLGGRIARPRRANGHAYQGINVLLLWAASIERGYRSDRWMTFQQARELGGCVRKGEKAETVVYADRMVRKDTDAAGAEVEHLIPFLKSYSVFNTEQIEGLPDAYYALPVAPTSNPVVRDAAVDAFFAATGATVLHGGSQAYYAIDADRVQMPPIDSFVDAPRYYAVLAHEMIHWTRHSSRLDRSFGRKRFGDEGYAQEELVAELGAAFACAELGITPEVREDHAAYIESWLKILKNDKRAIFTAASHAQRAFDFLQAFSAGTREAEDGEK